MAIPSERDIRPALLEVIAGMGGSARPADIYPVMTARFSLSAQDVSALLPDGRTPAWQNRIQWARSFQVKAGNIDGSQRGVWSLTSAGWDASGVAKESDAYQSEPLPEPAAEHPGDTSLDELIADLIAAGTDFASPSRLEAACAGAFRALGFDADVISGPGNTDVIVHAPLGVNAYTVVVDAKSTGRGKVADAQVDWLSINLHKERLGADHACIVGPAFGGGYLVDRATSFGIVLLAVDEFVDLLRMHSVTPFSLSALRLLFESSPLAKAAMPRLKTLARDRRRLQLLLERTLVLVDNFNRAQPDLVVAKAETLAALILANGDEALQGTTLDEVNKVLAILEAAGIMSALPTGGYASLTSLSGARARIASLVPGL